MCGEEHQRKRVGIGRVPSLSYAAGKVRSQHSCKSAAVCYGSCQPSNNKKNHQGIAKGITEWEVRVDGMKMKHDEELSATMKIAVLAGMLPKDYQDMCLQ